VILHIDLDIQQLVTGPGTRSLVSRLEFKRGDSAALVCKFYQNGIQTELPSGAAGTFALKPDGQYDADAIVGASSWTKTGTGTSTTYTFTPSFDTEELNDLLFHGDSDEENDLASITLMGEIQWTADAATYSTQTFQAIVYNDVIKGSESIPPGITPGTPENALYAFAVLNPSGSDNTIIIESVTAGTAGNALTAAIVINNTTARTALTATLSGNAITITSGDKRRIVLTGISSPTLNGSYTYAGEAGGKPSYAKDGVPTQTIAWSAGTSKWTIANLLDIANRFESTDPVDSPELVNTWTATGTASGTPSLAAAAANASQAMTLLNSDLDDTIAASLGGGESGTGSLAAVTTTSFSGGTNSTPGFPGTLQVDEDNLYVVTSIVAGQPFWKKVALAGL